MSTYHVAAGVVPILGHNCGNLAKDQGVAGGHAGDHVGMSDDELISRAAARGGPASSLNPETAQSSVDAVLSGIKIDKWAANNDPGEMREISKNFSNVIGRVSDASGNLSDAQSLTLVIKRVAKGTDGHKGAWIVYTMTAK